MLSNYEHWNWLYMRKDIIGLTIVVVNSGSDNSEEAEISEVLGGI